MRARRHIAIIIVESTVTNRDEQQKCSFRLQKHPREEWKNEERYGTTADAEKNC